MFFCYSETKKSELENKKIESENKASHLWPILKKPAVLQDIIASEFVNSKVPSLDCEVDLYFHWNMWHRHTYFQAEACTNL